MNMVAVGNREQNDGTVTAIVAAPPRPLHGASLLSLQMPTNLAQGILGGRYFLARCGAQTALEREEQWQIYLRRPLFVASRGRMKVEQAQEDEDKDAHAYTIWEMILPDSQDPGYRWLAAQTVGASINLIGPLGQGFTLLTHSRNLLLLATADRAAALLALIEPMLDRGGRVTLLVYTTGAADNLLLPLLSIPEEVRLATTDAQWQQHVTETLLWADQLCAAIPAPMLQPLADAIRRKRFRLEEEFAQVLVEAELACGVGACLACVVPVANGGYTRACVHGPVFDLTRLV
jgi:dihydroorotate dehydrogenase electron transfer subunit